MGTEATGGTQAMVAMEVMAAVSEVDMEEALVATVVSYIKICSLKNGIKYIFCTSLVIYEYFEY